MFDYATLRIIWWVLLGLLLAGFAIMDGFDLGIGMLLPFVTRNNDERRVVLNTIGPVWEGNQIWLILGGGAIFAAWPTLYAVSFSGFYFAMLLILFGLILRPVGFKYRGKIDSPLWRLWWDTGIFLGGLLPTLICGVALGNVLQGVPFYFDSMLHMEYTGTLFQLLNPFALLCGIVSIGMLIMHGGIFLAIKTEQPIQERAVRAAYIGASIYIICFALAGYFIAKNINGYQIVSGINPEGASNPLYKQASLQSGAWFHNYILHPQWQIIPALGFVGAIVAVILVIAQRYRFAWWASGISILGTIATVGISMFPFILPSSTNPNMSLLVWDSSSSQTTLKIMLIATIIFLPIILAYTSWVYTVLRGKVTNDYLQKNKQNLY